jgi:hypothetical protein
MRHESFGLVSKHCENIPLSWPYSHEQWKNEIMFENARDLEDVQTSMKSLNFETFYNMTPDD